jgi:hypothetical protein
MDAASKTASAVLLSTAVSPQAVRVATAPSITERTPSNPMTFKKGDKIQTEDGQMGEILFIDKNGLEAQVALAHVSLKFRTDSLRRSEPAMAVTPVARPGVAVPPSAKGRSVRRKPKS